MILYMYLFMLDNVFVQARLKILYQFHANFLFPTKSAHKLLDMITGIHEQINVAFYLKTAIYLKLMDLCLNSP